MKDIDEGADDDAEMEDHGQQGGDALSGCEVRQDKNLFHAAIDLGWRRSRAGRPGVISQAYSFKAKLINAEK